ncbi:DUF1501 domain-containing protein [Sungkyunkwania multivorans]|uniref:DUF1501 domain-containing protein n=1 Tax=Sungkyunkwania multivorans TaxID=1173618 RepID=A0ABW3CXQ2_9FLAO
MKRRDFIKRSSLASGALLVPSFLQAFDKIGMSIFQGKRLVVIQLTGGNDGLNTVVPFQNDIYYKNRRGIALPPREIIKLNDEVGLHAGLKELKELYDQGYLSVINNVGYPNPDRSHFRSSDIWHTASSSSEYLQTGWFGRYLDNHAERPYQGIEIDDTMSLIMKGEKINGIATKNAKVLYETSRNPYFNELSRHQQDAHLSEHNLGYLYKTFNEAKSSARYIYETSKTFTTKVTYPQNAFGKQLKTVSEFINSGLDTSVYYVSLGGFDTHANQLGQQGRLLKIYAEGIKTFVEDLKANGTLNDTLIFTFSEFGRRLKQNAAGGTDHGAANNIFIIGNKLKKQGIFNAMPDLSDLDANGDIKFNIDFRDLYATMLEKWLQVDSERVLLGNFRPLNIL